MLSGLMDIYMYLIQLYLHRDPTILSVETTYGLLAIAKTLFHRGLVVFGCKSIVHIFDHVCLHQVGKLVFFLENGWTVVLENKDDFSKTLLE